MCFLHSSSIQPLTLWTSRQKWNQEHHLRRSQSIHHRRPFSHRWPEQRHQPIMDRNDFSVCFACQLSWRTAWQSSASINCADEIITVLQTEVRGIHLCMCVNLGTFCCTYHLLVLDTKIFLVLQVRQVAAYVRFLFTHINAGNVHSIFFLRMNLSSTFALNE